MTSMTHTNQRLDYLDAVRAFALLLGIVFHASLSFLPVYIGWAVMDVSTSNLVAHFMLVSHSFRMELFFLVAGFFSHMTFHRAGAGPFVRSRLLRIAVPFGVGWFLLRPLLISGWVMGMQSLRGEVDFSAAMLQSWVSFMESMGNPFTGTHLWFLYYLLVITALVLAIRSLVGLLGAWGRSVTRAADAAAAWLCHSPAGMVVLALPTAAALWFMNHWGMDTPDRSLVPQLPVLLIYTGCFGFGWLLQRQSHLMESFSRLTPARLLMTLLAVIAAVYLSGFQARTGHPQYVTFKLAFVLSYALMMWSLVALTIGVFRRCLNRPREWVRYLADASYWLYLIHLPIVVWLQIAFAEVPWHWAVKLALISGITVAVSLLLYDLLIRQTFIGTVLNGRRKQRALRLRRNPALAAPL
ncbi:acyltransferase family protein [Gilvimarinus algae]|uniref:Acyltransferase family protein n=1 Tax=Gilvimarinus algae TaxID=3058037 RepID=A0ABT8TJY6_9GAMM|nr:acyltransferase family protein [Gilvimarinus sp. SDUM040014]MDO3383678.1 acyltransferase family protein [Gilvimarinus sp. SDUM040014]